MAVITSGNWSFKEPPLKDGDVVEMGNFSQFQPGTEICKDVKDLTIKGGLWINVKAQPTWRVEGGNWAQVPRCSHVHPDWVARGMAECPTDCEHYFGDEWIDIPVEEYRTAKALSVQVNTIDNTDADGVITQKFQKFGPVYRDAIAKVVQ